MTLPQTEISWQKSHRLIPSQYPPIDLFDDIAPPEDWEALARAESRTNPRIYEQIGNLSQIPVHRRVQSSWVMAAFTHYSLDKPTRFSDGSYGVYYCAKDFETALRESCYHKALFFQATRQPEGWAMQMRELVASVHHCFHDLRGENNAALLASADYSASQALAKKLRSEESNGIIYPSVRHEGGECLAAFWPDVIGKPKQAGHWMYHWNGEAIDYVKRLDGQAGGSQVFML